MRKLVFALIALLAIFTFIRDFGAAESQGSADAKAAVEFDINP